jgi:Inner membrane protein YgaP-like, transmembrane domain
MKNVGGFDKIFRIVVGVLILAAGFYFKSWWGLVGLVPLATGLINWCPIYLPFGIKTRHTKQVESEQ